MKFFPVFFMIALCWLSVPLHGADETLAKGGVLDLRAHPAGGAVSLQGEWQFYWDRLLMPAQLNRPKAGEPRTIHVPRIWNGAGVEDRTVTGHGVATYRLRVVVPEAWGRQTLGLYLGDIYNAYRIWINGVEYDGAGVVSRDRDSYVAELESRTIYFPGSAELDIQLQVANYSLPKGGLLSPVKIGLAEDIQAEQRLYQFIEVFLIGALLIAGLYHLGLYNFRRSSVVSLWFSVFCLCIAVRTAVTGERLLFADLQSWELGFGLDLGSYYLAVPAFAMFLSHLYPGLVGRWFVRTTIITAGCYVLSILLLDANHYYPMLIGFHVFTLLFCFYVMFVMATAIRHRELGAWWSIAGFAILFATIVNDILLGNQVIHSHYLSSVGVFFFILSQSLTLGKRLAVSFVRVEQLSDDLRQTNRQLEKEINQRREAERELNRHRDHLAEMVEARTRELQEANARLAAAKEQAEAAAKVKTQFLATMSHEIRTPLNAILGVSQLIELPAQQELIKTLKANADHLMTLINDILGYARLESDGVQLTGEDFSLASLLAELAAMFEDQARDKGLSLSFTQMPDVPEALHGDAPRLKQMLVNLIGNAVKFTAEGSIAVEVSREETLLDGTLVLLFRVEDTGIGIDSEHQTLLFNDFFQVDSSGTRSFGGTGLGLAITSKLATLMGGSVAVQSQPGTGSCFSLRLPFGEAESPVARQQDTQIGAGDTATSLRVLLAEDNPTNRLVIKAMLEQLGYDCWQVENGQEAVDFCLANEVDLVLMDIHMPVLDGIAATSQILARKPGLKIVALTANALPGDRERYLEAGMVDYISKPVFLERLGAVLMEIEASRRIPQ